MILITYDFALVQHIHAIISLSFAYCRSSRYHESHRLQKRAGKSNGEPIKVPPEREQWLRYYSVFSKSDKGLRLSTHRKLWAGAMTTTNVV